LQLPVLIVDAGKVVERCRLETRCPGPPGELNRFIDVPPGPLQVSAEEMELSELPAGDGEGFELLPAPGLRLERFVLGDRAVVGLLRFKRPAEKVLNPPDRPRQLRLALRRPGRAIQLERQLVAREGVVVV